MDHYDVLLSSLSKLSASGFHSSPDSALRGLGLCSGDDLLLSLSPLRVSEPPAYDADLLELSQELAMEQQCRSLPSHAHDDLFWGGSTPHKYLHIETAFQNFNVSSVNSQSVASLTNEIEACPALCLSKRARRHLGPECYRFSPSSSGLSSDPPVSGNLVRSVTDGRSDTSLRFPTENALCTLTFSTATPKLRFPNVEQSSLNVRTSSEFSSTSAAESAVTSSAQSAPRNVAPDSLSSESPTISFVHITWDTGCAPSNVFLQLSNNGQDWITADFVNLDNRLASELYQSNSKSSLNDEADDNQFENGTLLHASKLLRHTSSTGFTWKEQHACFNATHARLIFHNFHKSSNERRIIGVKNIQLLKTEGSSLSSNLPGQSESAMARFCETRFDKGFAEMSNPLSPSLLTSLSSSHTELSNLSHPSLPFTLSITIDRLFDHCLPILSCLSECQTDLSRNDYKVLPAIVRLLSSICLVSGSASALMAVVTIITRVSRTNLNILDSDVCRQMTSCASKLASAVSLCHSVRRRREVARELLEKNPSRSEISFDSIHKSSSMVISNGGSTISSLRSQRQAYASTNVGFPLIGRHSWTFRVDQDIENDETTCVGFCVRPVRDDHYEKSLDMWLVRCYSGETYNGRLGFVKKRIPHGPIHPQSIITFTLLKNIVSMEVDGTSQGVVFEIPPDIVQLAAQSSIDTPIVYPCVQMYAGDRSCTILNCTSEKIEPPALRNDKGVPLSTSLLLSRSSLRNDAALKTLLSSSTQLPVGSLGVDDAPPGPIMGINDNMSTLIKKEGSPSANSISLLPDIRAISALCQSTLSCASKADVDSSSRSAVVALAHFKIGCAFTAFSFRLRVQGETLLSGVDSKLIFQREDLSVRIYGDVASRGIDYRELLFSTESQRETLIFGQSAKTIFANLEDLENSVICLDVEDIYYLTVVVVATVHSSFSEQVGDDTATNLGDLDSMSTFVGETMCAAGLPVIVFDDAFLGPQPSASFSNIRDLLHIDTIDKDDLFEAASHLFSTLTIPYYQKTPGSNCEIDSAAFTRFYAEELIPFSKLIEITSQVVHLPLHSPRFLPQTPRVNPVRVPQRRTGGVTSTPIPSSRPANETFPTPSLDPGLVALANAVSRARSLQGDDAGETSPSIDTGRSAPLASFAQSTNVSGSIAEGQIRGWSEADINAAIAASLESDSGTTAPSLPPSTQSVPFLMPSIETIISLTGYDGNIEDIDEDLAQALIMSLPPEALLSLPASAKGSDIVPESILSRTAASEELSESPSSQLDLRYVKMSLFGAFFSAFLPNILDNEAADAKQDSEAPKHIKTKAQVWGPVDFSDISDALKGQATIDGILSFDVSSLGLFSTIAVIGSLDPEKFALNSSGHALPPHFYHFLDNLILILRLQLFRLDSKRAASTAVFPPMFLKTLLSYSSNNKCLSQCLHQWLSSSSSDLFFANTRNKIKMVIELIKSKNEPSSLSLSLWTSVVDDVRRGRFKILSSVASRNAATWLVIKTLISTVVESLSSTDDYIQILEQLNALILSRVSAALGIGTPCGNFQAWELSAQFAHESANTKISSSNVVATLSSIEFVYAEHFADYIGFLCSAVSRIKSLKVIRIVDMILSVCSRIAGNLSAAAHTAPSLVRVVELFRSFLPHVIKMPKIPATPIVNALSYPRRADRDNYSGQVGVRLRISDKCSPDGLVLYALGRAVCSKDGNRLQRDHILSLWNEDDQRLIATVLVSDDCVRDNDGFAIAELERPVQLFAGACLRLTSTEYAGCGDGWYEGKLETASALNLGMIEDYSDNFIELVGDCHKDALSWIDHSQSNASSLSSQQFNGGSAAGSAINSTGSYYVCGESLLYPDQGTTKARGPGMATLFYRLPQSSQQSEMDSYLLSIHTKAIDAAARSVASLIAALPESEEEESARAWMSLPGLKVPPALSLSEIFLTKLFTKSSSGDRSLMYSGCHSQFLVPTETLIDPNLQIHWKLLKMPESGKELAIIDEIRGKEGVLAGSVHDSLSDLVNGLVIVLSEGFDEIDAPLVRFDEEDLRVLKDISPGIFSAVEMWRNLTVPGNIFPLRGRSMRNEPAPPTTTLAGASAIVEAWLQLHSPEDRRKLYRTSVDTAGASVRESVGVARLDYSRPRPRFSRVCGPFLAAILRHTGLATEVVSALQSIASRANENISSETWSIPAVSLSLNRAWLKVKHIRNWIRDEIEVFETEAKEKALQIQLQSNDRSVNSSGITSAQVYREDPPLEISNSETRGTSSVIDENADDDFDDDGDDDDGDDGEDNGDGEGDESEEEDEGDEDEGGEEEGDEDEGGDGGEDEEGDDEHERIFSLTQSLMAGLGVLIGTDGHTSAEGLEQLVSLAARQLVPDTSHRPSQSQLRPMLQDLRRESSRLQTAAAQSALAINRRKRMLRANRIRILRSKTPSNFLDTVRFRCLFLLTTEVHSLTATLSNNEHLRGFVTPLVDVCSPLRSAGDTDQQHPLDQSEALMHGIMTYTKHGALAPPELLLSCVLRQLVRASQRSIGLSLQIQLSRLAKEGGSIIDLGDSLRYLRESFSGRSKTRLEKACALSIALADPPKNISALEPFIKYDGFEVIPGGMSIRLESFLMTPTSPLSSSVLSIGYKLWMMATNDGELMNGFPSPGCDFSAALSRGKTPKGLSGRQSIDEIGGFDLRSYTVGCLSAGSYVIVKLQNLFLSIARDAMSSLQSVIETSLDPCTDDITRDSAVVMLKTSMSLVCTDVPMADVTSILSPSLIESVNHFFNECHSKSIAQRIERLEFSFEDVIELFREYSPSTVSRDLLEGRVSKVEITALLRTVCKAIVRESIELSKLVSSSESESLPVSLETLLTAEGLADDSSTRHSSSSLGRVYHRIYRAACKVASSVSRSSTSFIKHHYPISLIRMAREVRATTEVFFKYVLMNCHIFGCFRRLRSTFSSISDAVGFQFVNSDENNASPDEDITIAGNSRSAIEALERHRDGIRRAHESLRRAVAVTESQYILSSDCGDALFLRVASALINEFVEACDDVNTSNERIYLESRINSFLIWLTRVASAPNTINGSGPLAVLFKSAAMWTSLLYTCVSRVSPRVSQQTLRLLSLSLPRLNPIDPVLQPVMSKIREDARFQHKNVSESLVHYFLFILSCWMNPRADLDIFTSTDSDGQSQWPFTAQGPGSCSSHLACSAELISTLRCLSIGSSFLPPTTQISIKESWQRALEVLIPKFIGAAALSATDNLEIPHIFQLVQIRSKLSNIDLKSATENMKMGLACLALVGSSSGCETLRVGARVLVRSSPLMSSDQDGIAYAPIGAGDSRAFGMATIVNFEVGSNCAQIIFEGASGAPLSVIRTSALSAIDLSAGEFVSDVFSSSFDKAAYLSLVSTACLTNGPPIPISLASLVPSTGSVVQQTTPTGCSMLTFYSGLGDSEDFDSSLLVPLDSFPPPIDLISMSDSTDHLSFLSSLHLLLLLDADPSLRSSTLSDENSTSEAARREVRRQRLFSGEFNRGDNAEASVPEVDEIVRLREALRASSLSAIDALVANPDNCAEIASSTGFLKRIMDIALVPSTFPTFVCPARFRQRDFALKCLLSEHSFGLSLESHDDRFSSFLSSPRFAEFNSSSKCVMAVQSSNVPRVDKLGRSDKRDQELTEAFLFESQALILVQMGLGFDLDACKFALKCRGDNLDSAANWLMSPEGSEKVKSEMEHQRVVRATLAASRESSTGLGAGGIGTQTGILQSMPLSGQQITKTAARWREAAELSSILGFSFPAELCFQALLLRGENKDSAIEWLLDSGSNYLTQSSESPLQEILLGESQHEDIGKRSNEAALEDISELTSLLPANMLPTRPSTAAMSSSTSTSAASVVAAMAAALMPPTLLTNGINEHENRSSDVDEVIPSQKDLSGVSIFSKADIDRHISAMGVSELSLSSEDSNHALSTINFQDLRIVYLTAHEGDVMVARSSPLSLCFRGRCGVLLPASITQDSTSRRLVIIVNPETGASTIVSVNRTLLRGTNRIFGRCVSTRGQIQSLLVANSIALGALIARRIAATIVHLWPSPQPLLGIGAPPLTLDEFGGSFRFVSLVKLIAAASQAFSSSTGEVENFSAQNTIEEAKDTSSAFPDSSSYPFVSVLRLNPVKALNNTGSDDLKFLHSETADVTIISGLNEQTQSRAGPSPLSLVDAVRSGLTRLLVQEVQSKLVTGMSKSNTFLPRSNKQIVVEASPLLRPMNTPMIRSITGQGAPPDLDLGSPCITSELTNPPTLTLDTPNISEAGISLLLPTPMVDEASLPAVEGSVSMNLIDNNYGNESKLARVLIEQCVRNFVVSTSADDSDLLTAKGNVEARAESLHPIVPVCEYAGELFFPGAKAIRVSFDTRCELDPAYASLMFFSDRALSQRLATYPISSQSSPGRQKTGPSAFPPLLVHSDKVFFTFKSERKSVDGLGSWGYRLVASPMRGLQWLNDTQVIDDPSLEWACWLLDFFLHDVGRLSKELFVAVHHKSIFDALVRYLRTPGAPFKNKVIVILTQLLAHPDAFPDSYTPDLTRELVPISNLCLERAHSLLSAGPGFSFLPPSLLQRVELASATQIAARFFKSRSSSGRPPSQLVDTSFQIHDDKKSADSPPALQVENSTTLFLVDSVAPTIGVAGFAPITLKTAIRFTRSESNEILGVDRVVFPAISKDTNIKTLSELDTQGVVGLKNTFLDLADLASALNTTPNAPLSACASGGAASASVDVMPDPTRALHVGESERVEAISSLSHIFDIGGGRDLFSSPKTEPGNNSIRFKDAHLYKAWYESCGSIAVVETKHPYRAGETFSGELVFPKAKSLRISLDRRTTLALGCSLRFWVTDNPDSFPRKPVDFCGAIHKKSKDLSLVNVINGPENVEFHLGLGATIADASFSFDTCITEQQSLEKAINLESEFAKECSTSAKLRVPCDMKAWTSEGKDVVVVDGCILRFAFVAPDEEYNVHKILDQNFANPTHIFNGPTNALGLWGAAFTVSVSLMNDSDRESTLTSDSTFKGPSWLPTLSLDAAAVAMAQWPRELDELIVSWVNSHSIKGGGTGGEDDPTSALGSKGNRRMVRSGLEMCADQFRLSRKEAKFAYEPLARAFTSILHCRFSLLRLFNRNLLKVLELVDATSASNKPLGILSSNGSRNVTVRQLSTGLPINEEIDFDPDSLSAGGSMLSQQLRSVSHLVFSELKNKLLDAAVTMTWVTKRVSHQSRVEIHLDNMRALLSSEAGQVDLSSGQCIFLQAFRQLSRLGPSNLANLFRSQLDERGCLFRVRYVNEPGLDFGGVFRDACTKMTEDLFSERLDLFLPTANAAQAAQGRQIDEDSFGAAGGDSSYLPNPKYCSLPSFGSAGENGAPTASSLTGAGSSSMSSFRLSPQLFEFVGQLMAMSLRTKLALPFELPSLMWKLLVGQSLTLNDLYSIDAATTTSILSVAYWSFDEGDLYLRPSPHTTSFFSSPSSSPSNLLKSSASEPLQGLLVGNSSGTLQLPNMSPTSGNRYGATSHDLEYSHAASAAFARAFPGLRFSTKSLDGRVIDLAVQGGRNVRVTLSTRWQYVQAALEYHMTAYDSAVKHIQRGLYSLVPARALRLLSWNELAFSVAGRPEIDTNQLRRHTVYEGYRATDSTIAMFWRVFESISNAERSLFIRFAWGRSRLPVKWGSTRFKLARRPAGDEQLPVAHTCFFSVELPPYSNESRMRTALLAAIYFSGGILSV